MNSGKRRRALCCGPSAAKKFAEKARRCRGGGYRMINGALKCAATLRTGTAGSHDESRCGAIHNSKVKDAQLKLAATKSKANSKSKVPS